MRSRIIMTATAIFLAVSVSQAQKLVVDVDRTVDFTKFKTYGWAGGQIAPNPATGQMIVAAVESELNSRGLIKNEADHDIQIAVMAAAGMDLRGVGPSWNNETYKSWGGYSNPSALMTINTGTLLIDLIETDKKLSIWRGVAKNIFVTPPTGNVAKDTSTMQKLVNKTVKKMFKEYPVKPGK